MKTRLPAIFFIFFIFGVSAATAQTSADADSLAVLTAKVSKFDKFLAALPRFSGYAQVNYLYHSNIDGVKGENSSTFNIRRVRLVLAGDISKTFDYKLQAEGFSTSRDQQGKALITLLDVIIRAKFRPEIHLQAGQFAIPLTLENYDVSPGTLEVPARSLLVSRMVIRNPVSGVSNEGRDIGLQASGSLLHREGYSIIDYNLALLNGSQVNRADDNKSKDIVARLTIRPLKALRISGSLDWGEHTAAAVAKNYIPMTRYAVGAWYEDERFLLRGEWGAASADATYTDLSTGDRLRGKVDERACYVVAGYKFGGGKYMPVVRYDLFDARQNTFNPAFEGRQQDFQAGFVYMPVRQLKVQTAWTLSKYAADGAKNMNTLEVAVIGYF